MKLITLFVISLFLFSCTQSKPAKESVSGKASPIIVGRLTKLKGSVLKNNEEAKIGETFIEGDFIETKSKSFAQLIMNDKTSITISGNSKLVLKTYVLDPTNRIVNINLLIGKIRTHFKKKLEGQGSLQVTTRTVSFGVRGTEFITQNSEAGKTKMLLLEGKVLFTKKNKNNQDAQPVEVKPMELVSMEENSEVIETSIVKAEDIVSVTNDEEMELNLDQVKIEELPPEINLIEPIKSSSIDPGVKVKNFLLSLEHSVLALPLTVEGKLAYFGDNTTTLPKDNNGQVISINPQQDNGEKKYIPVSEEFLLSIISKSSTMGVSVPKATKPLLDTDRKPASLNP